MLRNLRLAAMALLVATGFAACDDDNEADIEKQFVPTYEGKTAYVITQGNQGNKLPGGIDLLNLESKTVTSGAFYSANGQYLGDTPQSAVRYGSDIYVPMYGSNCVWAINASSLKGAAQVKVNEPEAVIGAGGYIFVARNDGYVERFSASNPPLSLTSEKTGCDSIEVGPNPAGLAAWGGKVFVTISDGYNYTGDNAYANGKKVVEIDAQTLTVTNTYSVGINPGQIFADSKGELFLVARGDYGANPSKIQKIATDGTVSDFCDGALMTLQNDTLYVLNTGYDENWTLQLQSAKWYAVLTGQSGDINFGGTTPVSPIAIAVSPVSGRIFVTSCASLDWDAYSLPGVVYEYKSVNEGGTHVHTYDVGVEPYSVVFF